MIFGMNFILFNKSNHLPHKCFVLENHIHLLSVMQGTKTEAQTSNEPLIYFSTYFKASQ